MNSPQNIEAAQAFNEANAAARVSNWQLVLEHSARAIGFDGALVNAWILNARAHRNLGNLHQARDSFQQAVCIDPNEFSAHLELGHALRKLGDIEKAKAAYHHAVRIRPKDHRGHLALSRLAMEGASQMREDSARHYIAALEVDRGDFQKQAQTHLQIGTYRLDARDAAGALEAFRAAEALISQTNAPSRIAYEITLQSAAALLRLRMPALAERHLQALLECEDHDLLKQASDLALSANLHELATALLRKNVAQQPNNGAVELELADMLAKAWRLSEARQSLSHAQAKEGVHWAAVEALEATIASRFGQPEQALEHFHKLRDAGEPSVASRIAMTTLYLDGVQAEEIARLHRDLFLELGDGARDIASFPNDEATDRPLRIGMVTKDLHRQHPVAIFMGPVLEAWDLENYPLTVYFTGDTYDEETAYARKHVTTWRDLAIEDVPKAVSDDEIDILIDLAGHTNYKQMAAFAKRMAPVQATYLGYPATTGVPNMDWLIGDVVVTPQHHASQYSEKLIQLPGTVFCYAPKADYPLPNFERSLERPLTFGSFNNVPKLTLETVALWSSILSAVPDSRLVLKAPSFGDAGVVQRYQGLFSDHGVDAARLEFRGPVGLDVMMAEYADIDIALDPTPYNGGTTSLQAMWMGVPVITLEGDHFVSRMGASFMAAADMPNWIAKDRQDYVAIAVRAAKDRPALVDLKAGLRAHLKTRPGWDPKHFTAAFQDALRGMWPPA
ncbi:MAG: tetratricopeptide repeat protein [Pseudomonadota bacterium]